MNEPHYCPIADKWCTCSRRCDDELTPERRAWEARAASAESPEELERVRRLYQTRRRVL